jgi:hypothetical protein
VALWDSEYKTFFPNDFHIDARIRDRRGRKGEIQIASQQVVDQDLLKIFAYIDLEIRESLAALDYQLRQDIGGQCRDGADGYPAFKGRVVAELLGRVLNLKEDPASPFYEHGAGLGQNRLASEAMENAMPKLAFQFYYLLA